MDSSPPYKGLPTQISGTSRGEAGAVTNFVTALEYDDLGRITRQTRQPSTTLEQKTTYTYYGLTEKASPPPVCGGGDAVLQAGLPRREIPEKNGPGQPPGKFDTEAIYDATGRVIGARLITSPQLETAACLFYDARGRRQRAVAPKPTSAPAPVVFAGEVTYKYNGDDALIEADDNKGGKVVQDFDRQGRLTAHRDANGNTTTYSYDRAGRPTGSSGPAGDKTNTFNGANGRLVSTLFAAEGIANQSVSYGYDWAGRLTTSTRTNTSSTNKTATTYTYGPASELAGMENQVLGSAGQFVSSISRHTYQRDRLGRIATQIGPEGKTIFDYDDAGRLERASLGNPTGPITTERLYSFDARTNRTRLETRDPKVRAEAPGASAPPKFAGQAGPWRYNAHSTIFASPNTSNPDHDARLVYGPDTLRDFDAQVDVKFHSGAVDAGIDLRWRNGGADRYIVAMRAGNIAIHKVRGGVIHLDQAVNAAFQHALGTWYRLKVVARGGNLKVFRDGALALDWTDPDAANPNSYAKAGYSQGAIALSSFRTWAEFDTFTVNAPGTGAELVRDGFEYRAPQGDWRPDSGELRQHTLNRHETVGLGVNGSNITTSQGQDIRTEIRFDAGFPDGGIRFRKVPGSTSAYTLALRGSDLVLFDSDGSVAQSVPRGHGHGITYSIRVLVNEPNATSTRVRVIRNAEQLIDWTDTSNPLKTGEVAPYSWTAAMTIRSLVVLPASPSQITDYAYNKTDQMTKDGAFCNEPDCPTYDYRGNTTKASSSSFYRFDTSNRMVYSRSIPEAVAGANPIVVSPSGQAIVFSSIRDGNDEIYTMAPNGTGQVRLTDNFARDLMPAYSSDGSRIYFASDREGTFQIYSMRSDGSDLKRLTNTGGDNIYPAPSPDGTKLVISSTRDNNYELYLINLAPDGYCAAEESQGNCSATRLTTTGSDQEIFPRFGPDSKTVVFSSGPGPIFAFHQITTLDITTGARTTLTSEGVNLFPAYDSSGTKITFTSGRDGNEEIYLMASDGSAQTRLTDHPGDDAGSTFTPEGKILFGSTRDSPEDRLADAYLMEQDGSGLTRLTTDAMITSIPITGQGSTAIAEVTYTYDALGRMKKMTSTQGAFIDEMDFGYSGPTDSHSYIQRSGEIVFRAFSGMEGLYATANKIASGWNFRNYHFDGRGDTRAITTPTGGVAIRTSYDEYGRASANPNVRLPYEFMGKHQRFYNAFTGLVHMGARMYQPKTGRFLSRDPITGGSANDYEYTAGDPVNRGDLTGTHSGEQCYAELYDESLGLGNVAYAIYCYFHGHSEEPGSVNIGGRWYSSWALEQIFGGLGQRDLGKTNLNRRVRNTVNWAETGIAASENIPFWGVGIAAKRCTNSGGQSYCAISTTASAAASLVTSPYILLSIPVGFIADTTGQLHGGASLW